MIPAAVVIVSYNTRDLLRSCLQSVLAQRPAEIVVVDNASTDGSGEMVARDFPGIRLEANARNVGYGAAANQGIRASMAPFVLLLNGDTWLESEALHRLVEHLRSRPRCALAGPRLSNPDGSYQASRFPALTPLNLLILNTNLCRLARFVPVLRRRFRALWSPDPGIEADWIKGAALIVRRDAFTAVGGFDESFFLYSEETDLCHRLRAAGWEIDWVPQAVVVHAEAASTGQAPEGMIVEKFASLGRFYRRHWPQRLPQLRRAIWVITAEWIARDRLKLLLPFGAERRRRVAGRLATWGRIRRLDWQSSSSQESPRATPR